MKFGICSSWQDADAALEAGFDYVELGASSMLENLDAYRRLKPPATNLFFPGTMRLYGPEKTPYLDYARDVVTAASRIGIDTMVIGSGAARKAPEGMDLEEAESLFIRMASEISEFAAPLGITIAPESLNRTETNVGNDLGTLASELHDVGVDYTADSYHVLCEWIFDGNEPAPSIDHWRNQVPYLPAHVHIGSRDRYDPTPDDADLLGFVQRLSELGYDGRISLECKRRAHTDLRDALRDIKALFGKG